MKSEKPGMIQFTDSELAAVSLAAHNFTASTRGLKWSEMRQQSSAQGNACKKIDAEIRRRARIAEKETHAKNHN